MEEKFTYIMHEQACGYKLITSVCHDLLHANTMLSSGASGILALQNTY